MAKPSGSVCNIDCSYCFYLEKEKLYPDAGRNWRMSDEVMELYVKQYIEAQDVPAVNFAWQGGEPTCWGSTSSAAPWSCRSATPAARR